MATTMVRFEFWCETGSTKLKYMHSFPNSLIITVTTDSPTRLIDAAYANLFLNTLQPIMEAHKSACLSASRDFCGVCGSPTTHISQIPMSWLHKPEDPYVALWVTAICGSQSCAIKTRQRVQDEMARLVLNSRHRTLQTSTGAS